MNSIRLYYIKHMGDQDLEQTCDHLAETIMPELSPGKQAAIQRLVNYKDRMTSLLGLLLLKMCAKDESVDDFMLSDVQYPKSGKPFWGSKHSRFDFNVSHSGNLILVAASTSVKLGIDAEKIRPLKNLKFNKVMVPEELAMIEKTPDLFFDLWSKKEAVVKAADTAGLSRMLDVQLEKQQAVLDGTVWYLKKISLPSLTENSYSVQLATSAPAGEVSIKQLQLSELNF